MMTLYPYRVKSFEYFPQPFTLLVLPMEIENDAVRIFYGEMQSVEADLSVDVEKDFFEGAGRI